MKRAYELTSANPFDDCRLAVVFRSGRYYTTQKKHKQKPILIRRAYER